MRQIFAGSPEAAYVISSQRDLYLDTSFILSRGRALGSLPWIARSYTGSLTFVELLADIGVSEREFAARKRAMSTLLNADIVIDWQIPKRKIPGAFAIIREKYDVFDDTVLYLQKLVNVAVSSRSRAEFEDRIQGSPLTDAHEHFRSVDKQLDESHRETIEGWIRESPVAFADPSRSMLFDVLSLPESTTHAQLCYAMAESILGCQIFVYAFMELYAEEQGINDEAGQERLYHSYDHSIDAYVAVSASKMWRHAATKQQPARNDGIDEDHLLYLPPGVTLVTSDRKFAQAVEEARVPVRFEGHGG